MTLEFKEKISEIREKEKFEPKIVLHFFRHAEERREEGMKDIEVPLSEKGKELAFEKGGELQPQKEVSLGSAAPKRRTVETVKRVIGYPEITSEMSLADVEAMFQKHLKIGKKVTIDERLCLRRVGELEQRALQALQEGRVLDFIVLESDQLAKEIRDKESLTYSKMAANIAEIVQEYSKIFDVWEKINKQYPEKYKDYHYQLERYFCSHQTVLGSFIAKVIEKLEGHEGRNDFLILVGDKGLERLEGFKIEILRKGEEKFCIFSFKTEGIEKNLFFNERLLSEIRKDGEKFKKELEEICKNN